VYIDSDLREGSLTYGEYLLEGELADEFLISTHICHPSMANDNVSGIVVSALLGKILKDADLKYSYRFIFIPGTIGAITWLSRNESILERIRYGLVISGVGDSGRLTYKRSRRGNTGIDRIIAHIFANHPAGERIDDFIPYGYDERQYCSPGFNLPVGRLSRTAYGTYPEYHTSADNLDFMSSKALYETLEMLIRIVYYAENNMTCMNMYPKGEPQLGKRGIYNATGGHGDRKDIEMAILWVLNMSDGSNDILSIASKSGLSFEVVADAAKILFSHQMIRLV
jgi:aminopeptidase-like protein